MPRLLRRDGTDLHGLREDHMRREWKPGRPYVGLDLAPPRRPAGATGSGSGFGSGSGEHANKEPRIPGCPTQRLSGVDQGHGKHPKRLPVSDWRGGRTGGMITWIAKRRSYEVRWRRGWDLADPGVSRSRMTLSSRASDTGGAAWIAEPRAASAGSAPGRARAPTGAGLGPVAALDAALRRRDFRRHVRVGRGRRRRHAPPGRESRRSTWRPAPHPPRHPTRRPRGARASS